MSGLYEGDVAGTIHRGGALTFMDGCPLGKLMREALGVPVAVNNDGKCCALGEYAAGALRGTRFGVVLAIGTGIGGGIVIDGKVLRGTHCFAGEFSFLRNDVTTAASTENSFAGSGGRARAFDGQLINLQAVLDPEVFVIAGGISCHPELVDALRAQMPLALAGYEGTLAGITVPQIKVAELGNDANLYGAVQEAMRLV